MSYYAEHSKVWGRPVARLLHGRCVGCSILLRWPEGAKSPRVRDAYCPTCGCKIYRTAAALLEKSKVRIVEDWPIGVVAAATLRAKRTPRPTHPDCETCATRLVCPTHRRRAS